MIWRLRWSIVDHLIFLAIAIAPPDPAKLDLILTIAPWWDRQFDHDHIQHVRPLWKDFR